MKKTIISMLLILCVSNIYSQESTNLLFQFHGHKEDPIKTKYIQSLSLENVDDAQLEEIYLKFYYRIPLCSTTVCTLLSYQINYYTEDYNIMYGFGGLRLMTYNYNDADWAAYVKSEGGTLNYN